MNGIKVLKIVERKDGSADVQFEYDKEFATFVKKYYNRKRVTKNMIKKFVYTAITSTLKHHPNKLIKNHGKRTKN